MTVNEAVQKVIAGKMSIMDAIKALRGVCTSGQFVTALHKTRAERAEKIGRRKWP